MNGPNHYLDAERLLAAAADAVEEGDYAAADRMLAAAQVHATLAQAASVVDAAVPTMLVRWAMVLG
jgi:hypothetical protein